MDHDPLGLETGRLKIVRDVLFLGSGQRFENFPGLLDNVWSEWGLSNFPGRGPVWVPGSLPSVYVSLIK